MRFDPGMKSSTRQYGDFRFLSKVKMDGRHRLIRLRSIFENVHQNFSINIPT